MYTQCPDCSTVFRVTAEALRAAQGSVRCGICSAVFNALENLSEAPVARPSLESGERDTITVEELPGNEFIELSGAGDTEPDAPSGEDTAAWEVKLAAAAAAGEEAVEEEQQEEEQDEVSTEAPDVPDSTPAAEAAVDEILDVPDSAAASEAADEEAPATPEGDPFDSIPDTALEFRGSAEDLERLFVPAGLPSTGAGPAPADLPEAIEEIASQDLSGIEVREEELSWPATGGTPFDPANPAHVAAVLARPPGDPATHQVGGLDDTDEYPVLVVEEYEAELIPGDVAGTADDLQSGRAREAAVETDGLEADAGGAAEGPEGPPGDEEAVERPSPEGEVRPPGDAEPGEDSREEEGEAAEEADEDLRHAAETIAGEPHAGATAEAPALLIIPEELRRGPSATAADELDTPLVLDEEPARRWPLLAAGALLLVILAAQAVHHWRHDLVRDPVAGPWVMGTYRALGLGLRPPVDLAAFELRQLGAASDPGQAGRIKVRASIVNHAPFAQPYPLLRLSLQDRFGSTIGARNLTAAEYLPGGSVDPSGLLGATQRADAEVVFVDPGREAVGFELDLCMEGESGLLCGADLPRSPP